GVRGVTRIDVHGDRPSVGIGQHAIDNDRAAGLAVAIVAEASQRTGLPLVVAAGDVVEHERPFMEMPLSKSFLALASWCAMTGGMRKIGRGVFRSIPLWGSDSRCPVDKKARRMDPHSISMETHHACHRRRSDYHHPRPRQLRGPDPLT